MKGGKTKGVSQEEGWKRSVTHQQSKINAGNCILAQLTAIQIAVQYQYQKQYQNTLYVVP